MIEVSAEEIYRRLPMTEAIDIVRETMKLVSAGKAELPLRSIMDIDGTNKLGIMPGVLRDPTLYGVKILSLFPGNPAKGLSSHIGAVILFDSETGKPAAFLDADALTAIRTAAASAAATDALARENASTLAIIGTGEQAGTHIQALHQVRTLSDIRIIGRTQEKAEKFVAQIQTQYPNARFSATTDTATAVVDADIVCTVTSSSSVILKGDWISPGTHVNAVGASVPSMQEIDQDLIFKSELFVDYKPSALAQARDIMTALETGAIQESHILGEIGDVYSREIQGRRSPHSITLYRSLGVAAQDLSCANYVFKKEVRK